MEKQFKAGDKVRNVKDTGWELRHGAGSPVIGNVYTVRTVTERGGLTFISLEEVYRASGMHTRYAEQYELVTEPQQEFVITRVYPNGGYGVTHYFDTEQEAREYLRKAGNSDGGYKFSRLTDSQMLKVQEVSTVTRSVVLA